MDTSTSKWDVQRAASWLKKHWAMSGPEPEAPSAPEVAAIPEPADASDFDEDIDIAGWPALVAPFYD